MAQYVVHKIGFFFTDENFKIEQERGNVVRISKSLEEAKAIKYSADIVSMKGLAGDNAVLFYLDHPNCEEITKNLTTYLNTGYGNYISRLPHLIMLPHTINDEQAAQFLSIMELTFHTIVEYGDDEVIDPTAFDLNTDETCWF